MSTFTSLPDPPGGTRIELIRARLHGDWDEVDRILATHQPQPQPPTMGIIEHNHHEQENNTMSDTMEYNDEASAVVDDDGASALAPSESAYEGEIDPRYRAEVDQAMQEVGRYCEIDSDGAPTTPLFVKNGDMNFLLGHVAKWHGLQGTDDALELFVDEYLVAFQTQKRYRDLGFLGAVSLDLSPDGPWVQDMGHPTAPKVVFLAIDKNLAGSKPFFKAEADERGPARQYMAVWFVPNSELRQEHDRTTGELKVTKTGEPVMRRVPLTTDGDEVQPAGKYGKLYCDDKYLDGYLGIVDWFDSRSAAKQAMRDLQRAVRTIGKPPVVATVPDSMRDELLDADAEFDRKLAAWKAGSTSEPMPLPADPFA